MAGAKPTIVHVIDSLTRGGAETLLVNLLPALAERYDIILVTLGAESDFPPEALVCRERHYLGYTGTASLPLCVWRLRRIIRRVRPSLVRSQLFMSSVVARLATPRCVPLVFSIHNPMSEDAYSKNRLALPLERLTYARRHALIGVSESALRDFQQWVGVKGPSFVLHNFINQAYVEAAQPRDAVGTPTRIVAVGMLKEQKNYFALLDAMKRLPGRDVSLDIYGDGPLREPLQARIDAEALPVTLKGKRADVHAVLGEYDLYVMSSTYEGFGIAPIEAMAAGLPLLLSDLPVLREVTEGNALFFDPHDPETFVRLVEQVRAGAFDLGALSRQGVELARARYGREAYVEKLAAIYATLMTASSR
jgi:glycosyltransferase involved in cell wall biosynthesis